MSIFSHRRALLPVRLIGVLLTVVLSLLLGSMPPWTLLGTTAHAEPLTQSTTPISIWSNAATPRVVAVPDSVAVELGMKFRIDVAGSITGLRFYKSSSNTGTHVASLWTSSGQQVAAATFTNETASGWQQVHFATPVTIAASTTYVASYHAPNGHYSMDEEYFAAAEISNGPLRALKEGVTGGNGVYKYGASGFPTQTYRASNYWVDVLFVPTDSSTLPAPVSPTTMPLVAPTPIPVAGQTCPSWVHDRYVTTGPDGQPYPTWHPQRDQEYGCYFHHEHGSNPTEFPGDFMPSYGYVNVRTGMEEAHQGFKSFMFDDSANRRWLVTPHLGTGNNTRQCARFHALNIAIADKTSGELLANVYVMADFGASYINTLVSPLSPSQGATRPEQCADQYRQAAAEDSKGSRFLPSVPTDSRGYEPWTIDSSRVPFINSSNLNWNTLSTMASCATDACSTMVYGANNDHQAHGALRFMSFTQLTVRATDTMWGQFVTDDLGRTLGGSLAQYVKPGLVAAADPIRTINGDAEEYWPLDGTNMFYEKTPKLMVWSESVFNIDGQLRIPN